MDGIKPMKFLLGILFSVIAAIIGVFAVVSSGMISVAADKAHQPMVYDFLNWARSQSIAKASEDIIVPKLDEAAMISSGGADYNDMCAGCHLSPAVESTDLSAGLYPKPPNFTDVEVAERYKSEAGAQQSFWAIKHGIMASGMPAWGATHDDDRLWAMVAFIRVLPELSADQYTMLTTRFDTDMLAMSLDSEAMEMTEH